MAGKKPPPITVAPGGIDAHGAMGGDARHLSEPALRRLAGLPPFQSFIASREQAPEGTPADRFAYERAIVALRTHGHEAFLADYEAWHQSAGKWPNETPYGEPL